MRFRGAKIDCPVAVALLFIAFMVIVAKVLIPAIEVGL